MRYRPLSARSARQYLDSYCSASPQHTREVTRPIIASFLQWVWDEDVLLNTTEKRHKRSLKNIFDGLFEGVNG